jgi:16S rRNA (cytosine967-C5)-methyltransferase
MAQVSPSRSAAYDVLLRVATRDSYAVELLHSTLLDKLNAADRALATELVMGTLRWQQKLDRELESAGGRTLSKFDIEVLLALRLGAYQLRFLERVPARAAVNESVELVKTHGKRSAAPLVNAVLRKLTNPAVAEPEPNNAAGLAAGLSHPEWMVDRWIAQFGSETARSICEYDQQRPATSIRCVHPEILDELRGEGVELEPGSLVVGAYRVLSGDILRASAYRERRLTIQDEGSQLVALLASGSRILDCCAAPGGKSAVVRERDPDAVVVSSDLHVHRVRLMRELTKASPLLVADARRPPFGRTFDSVIADLPCTGTGTLSRNPEIKWRLKPEDLPRLATLQFEILRGVAECVVTGGTIVYSTCSLEHEEGEEVVRKFVSEQPGFKSLPIATRVEELVASGALHRGAEELLSAKYLRTIPGLQHCDGFFAALLRRR